MKKLFRVLFIFTTISVSGQYKEYTPDQFKAITGNRYPDIAFYGFKDPAHARRVLDAISAKGFERKDLGNSFYYTQKEEFVVQGTKRVNLLKDAYVLHYLPKYEGTALVLEIKKISFKPWNTGLASSQQSVVTPEANVKVLLNLIEEVKQLVELYKSNDEETQKILKTREVQKDSLNKVYAKEEYVETEKKSTYNVSNVSASVGFNKENVAFEALNEAVKDFNASIVSSSGDRFTSTLTSAVNWKKIKTIEVFNDADNPYSKVLMTCKIGDEGAQSGYVVYSVAYNNQTLNITCVELLKIAGVVKKHYDHSDIPRYKGRSQLGLTDDQTYRDHSSMILQNVVNHLEKYKNNPDFANHVLTKQAQEKKKQNEQERAYEERIKQNQAKVKANREINKKALDIANNDFKALEEGQVVCLLSPSDYINSDEAKSNIIGYVEKYNSTKSKLQIKIHQPSNYIEDNKYESIAFEKGDFIWVNLPMTNSNHFWAKCGK